MSLSGLREAFQHTLAERERALVLVLVGDVPGAARIRALALFFALRGLLPFVSFAERHLEQPLGFALPMTYWLEPLRRALLGLAAGIYPTLAAFSNAQFVGILGGITLAFALLSGLAFRYFERRARELGLIDAVSNF